MSDKFEKLSDVITKDKAFSKFRSSLNEQDVVEMFGEIFPEFSKSVSASNVHKGILYLAIENSVIRNELHLNKGLMIEKINKHFNQRIIVDIKFTNFRTIYRKRK